MNKLIAFVILFLLIQSVSPANILPADKSVLNFTQVMFEFDEQLGADTYSLTIITPDNNKQLTFTKKSLACLVTTGLQFGKHYQWYYEAKKNGRQIFKSSLFEFSIENSVLADSGNYRYNIIKQTKGKFENDLLLMDNHGVAINRKGEAVWYLPTDSAGTQKVPYRNLSFTAGGTITYLKNTFCCEKDIYGNLIWQAPNDGAVSGDSIEYYHHDFSKLSDGTYLTCSYKYEKTPNYYDPGVTSRVRYNTLIQYDVQGNVIWSWNERDHVSKAEIFKQATPTDTEVPGTHLNGFDYDKKTNTIILSYRNNSTLMLIDKANGEVLNVIKGESRRKGESDTANLIRFYKQHGPTFKTDGSVLFYNNNVQKDEKAIAFPIIMNLQIPADNTKPKLLWQYECKLAEHPEGWTSKEGYVTTLQNKNMLVCIGGSNKIMEVSPDKKVVWEMNCESYDKREKKWKEFSNYRSHAISSLYPQYFTVQNMNGSYAIAIARAFQIKINNDGTEAGEYKIEIIGNETISSAVNIAAQSSVTRTINLPKTILSKGNNTITIKISPLLNASLTKTLIYVIK